MSLGQTATITFRIRESLRVYKRLTSHGEITVNYVS
jgi:hypothetical protein